MNDAYKSLAIIAVTVSLVAFIFGLFSKNVPLGSVGSSNVFSGGVTNSSTTLQSGVAATTSDINASRQYVAICNNNGNASSGPVTIYLNFVATDTSLSVSQGIPVETGECYEINNTNLYTGQIWAIATDTAYISTIEK